MDNKGFQSKNDNQKANILCGISLACEILPFIAAFIIDEIVGVTYGDALGATMLVLTNAINILLNLMRIAGVVILIYVRVKYPKNIFGKVLMWVYIIYAIIILVLLITLIMMCHACANELRSCGFLYPYLF